MKISKMMLVIAVALLFTANVKANSIRCDYHVIEDGGEENIPTLEEVRKLCGEPTSVEGNRFFYEKQGKRLDFDGEGNLMSIHDINDEEDMPQD